MKHIDIGRSGLYGSEIALGCMYMHEMTVPEAAAHIRAATEQGVNFFDHADIYGGGACEEIFGKALRETGLAREDVILQSKCGIQDYKYDFSKRHILDAVHGSLKRLQVEYLDILLLHRPDALMEPEEIADAFNTLQNQGLVRHFGVSNHHPMQIELLQQAVGQRLIANQLRFSPVHSPLVNCGILVNTMDEGAVHRDGMLLDYCRANGITIQAWSPYQYGDNAGVYLDNDAFPALNEALARAAREYGISKQAVVAAWILRHPARMQVLAGTTSSERLADICTASGVELDRKTWYDIYECAGNTIP